jgi:ribosomal protein L40E
MPKTMPSRPLSCHKCGSADVRVESDTDYAQRAGKRRVTAQAICEACGHRWPSVHPDAVARARALAKGQPA